MHATEMTAVYMAPHKDALGCQGKADIGLRTCLCQTGRETVFDFQQGCQAVRHCSNSVIRPFFGHAYQAIFSCRKNIKVSLGRITTTCCQDMSGHDFVTAAGSCPVLFTANQISTTRKCLCTGLARSPYETHMKKVATDQKCKHQRCYRKNQLIEFN